MTCTCTCHRSSGHRINRWAFLGAKIVELRARIPELARKTPPKTLIAERMRVEAAKANLPKVREALREYEQEHATLSPGTSQEGKVEP